MYLLIHVNDESLIYVVWIYLLCWECFRTDAYLFNNKMFYCHAKIQKVWDNPGGKKRSCDWLLVVTPCWMWGHTMFIARPRAKVVHGRILGHVTAAHITHGARRLAFDVTFWDRCSPLSEFLPTCIFTNRQNKTSSSSASVRALVRQPYLPPNYKGTWKPWEGRLNTSTVELRFLRAVWITFICI